MLDAVRAFLHLFPPPSDPCQTDPADLKRVQEKLEEVSQRIRFLELQRETMDHRQSDEPR